jgi:hypothetical protein
MTMKKKQKPKHCPTSDFGEVIDCFESDLAILETPEITQQRELLMQELSGFRGRMLGLCCDVESALDAMLIRFFHPHLRVGTTEDDLPIVSDDPISSMFRNLILCKMQFNAKIRVLESLNNEVEGIQKLLPAPLLKQLDKVREFRNDLAHNPINLRLAGQKKKPYLKPVLCTPKKEIALTNDCQTEKWDLFENVRNDLQSVADELEWNPLRGGLGNLDHR